MKKIVITIILICTSVFLYPQLVYNKISSIQGNFNGNILDGDKIGTGVEVIGDINGDGIEDMAVGSRFCDDGGTNRGAVWIMFMDANMNVSSHQKISSTHGNFYGSLSDGDEFGCAIASLGDLDNDGVIDIVVGAWGDDDGGINSGASWILFLYSNGTVKSFQKISSTQGGLQGLTSNRHFGLSLCSVGDLNSDGNTDIVVGTPAYDNDGGLYRGCIWVLFLNTNGTVAAQQKINDVHGNLNITLDNEDRFGYGLSCIGDLNNDGLNDIVTSSLYDDDGGTDIGAIYVIMLDTNGTCKNYQKISATQGGFTGTLLSGDRFGYGVTGTGDINGDGILDIAVGAPADNDSGNNTGAVWVLYLNTNGYCIGQNKISDSSTNFTGDLDSDDWFGVALSRFHDLNGDGGIELVVGAIGDDDGGTDRGAVWIIYVKDPTFIESNKIYSQIKVFPNPTSGSVIIKNEEFKIKNVSVIDIYGKEVLMQDVTLRDSKCELDLSQQPKGIYIVKVTTERGVAIQKVVLE